MGNYTLPSGQSMLTGFRETSSFTLVGAWSAHTVRGTLTFWVLNATEVASFNATGNTGGYEVLMPNATGSVTLDLPILAGAGFLFFHHYDEQRVYLDVTRAVAAQT